MKYKTLETQFEFVGKLNFRMKEKQNFVVQFFVVWFKCEKHRIKIHITLDGLTFLEEFVGVTWTH